MSSTGERATDIILLSLVCSLGIKEGNDNCHLKLVIILKSKAHLVIQILSNPELSQPRLRTQQNKVVKLLQGLTPHCKLHPRPGGRNHPPLALNSELQLREHVLFSLNLAVLEKRGG